MTPASVLGSVSGAGGPNIPSFGHASSCVSNNGTFCWDWFTENWSSKVDFQARLFEHVKLTVIAVVIGFTVAFALAVLAHRKRWLVPPVTFVGSLLYTIPSLAAFQILVTITGINDFTVEIALVSYTLLILFTNTLAGLSAVPPDVVDAARGTGLTDTQILLRVELPLAVPTIIAGLRVAVVTIISLATVAAFIVPEGLGKPIFDALNAGDFNTKFIASGVLCILLALFADALFVGVQRVLTPWASARRTR
ncbi:MAG: osmoprotectant transport system permease protein [Nocardioidaceae bacterium]|jgi:osmoprotectant transport system permease protein|nr:osmoprotectant transport system permease protein [Nocardioidaceae bacterium]